MATLSIATMSLGPPSSEIVKVTRGVEPGVMLETSVIAIVTWGFAELS
jgi:hypothetical protein